MLTESYRILKKGGILRIATPNIDFLFNIHGNPVVPESIYYVDWAVKNIHQLKSVEILGIDKEEYYIYVINNFFKDWGHQVIHNFTSINKWLFNVRFLK